ncbi:MAG TPA: histone deacetylase [Bryobacteraceae bacterium]|jgi:acetoin utilization deacetylase AcuC-like enzyme
MHKLFYCDHHSFNLPDGHKFPTRKYRLTRDLLAPDGCFEFERAPLADSETVMLAHDPEYVSRFIAGTLDANVMRRIGFPWSRGLVDRTLASVGGTLAAAQIAIEKGWCGNLAGGTHHAFYAEGAGFCVWNDMAITIHALRKHHGLTRFAVIDLDVHQGDGTAQMFATDPDVLTLSFHGKNNFPFRKQTSKIDVAFEDHTGDTEYLRRLTETLPLVFDFRPQAVFYQSGVDALASDRLGRMSLTAPGLAERDRLVLTACRNFGAPTIITMGGGYSDPIELSAAVHAETYRTAARLWAS